MWKSIITPLLMMGKPEHNNKRMLNETVVEKNFIACSIRNMIYHHMRRGTQHRQMIIGSLLARLRLILIICLLIMNFNSELLALSGVCVCAVYCVIMCEDEILLSLFTLLT